jgi:hypothetical protein
MCLHMFFPTRPRTKAARTHPMGLKCYFVHTHRPHTNTNQDCKDSPDGPHKFRFYKKMTAHAHEPKLQGLTRWASHVDFARIGPTTTQTKTARTHPMGLTCCFFTYRPHKDHAARLQGLTRWASTAKFLHASAPHEHEPRLQVPTRWASNMMF